MSTGGLSKRRLARMHEVMADHVDRGEMPGLVSIVGRRGAVHVDAIGSMDVSGGRPMQRDTIFRISSMTKPITAVASMMLVEECVLRLDEPVDRLLPELAERKVLKRIDGPLDETEPAHRPITVRDLLTFRMGFGVVMAPTGAYPIQAAMDEFFPGQGPPNPAKSPPPDQYLRLLGGLPLLHQPGERWMYNTGSDVLGVLIERASGQPFETFLRERIFDPLGMTDTAFSVPASQLDRLATSYSTNPENGTVEVYDEAAGGQWSRPPAFPTGGGGLVSTVDDYLVFALMLLDQGRSGTQRLLSRPSVELMTINHLTATQRVGTEPFLGDRGWGFGMAVVTNQDALGAAPGQYGWDGGLGTSWASDPREELVGILMTQAAWETPAPPSVCADFWTSAYQAIDD